MKKIALQVFSSWHCTYMYMSEIYILDTAAHVIINTKKQIKNIFSNTKNLINYEAKN